MAEAVSDTAAAVTSLPRFTELRSPSEAEWDILKSWIIEWYRDEDQTLTEVQGRLRDDFNYNATAKQLKTRLAQWGVFKNIRGRDRLNVGRQIEEYRMQHNVSPSMVLVNGRFIETNRVKRSIRRHNARRKTTTMNETNEVNTPCDTVASARHCMLPFRPNTSPNAEIQLDMGWDPRLNAQLGAPAYPGHAFLEFLKQDSFSLWFASTPVDPPRLPVWIRAPVTASKSEESSQLCVTWMGLLQQISRYPDLSNSVSDEIFLLIGLTNDWCQPSNRVHSKAFAIKSYHSAVAQLAKLTKGNVPSSAVLINCILFWAMEIFLGNSGDVAMVHKLAGQRIMQEFKSAADNHGSEEYQVVTKYIDPVFAVAGWA